MTKEITITLSDRAQKYLANLAYGLDFDGEPATESQCVSHALEELAAFEELEDDQVTNYLHEKHPEAWKKYAVDYLHPLLNQIS